MALPVGARWALATPALLVLLYILFVGLLLIPRVQRHALYVHKLNSALWHDIKDPTIFGFGHNQVRTFTITCPDGPVLHAWHVLPLNIYAQNRNRLLEEAADSSLPLTLLTSDPTAKVLISFHGNAGHVAQGWRTDTYRSFSSLPDTHLLTVDYRGFGYSTGSPTEEGLITDGIALVNYVRHTLGVPANRIAIVGQSLGTAVAAAVALYFADPSNERLPMEISGRTGPRTPLLGAQGEDLDTANNHDPSDPLTYQSQNSTAAPKEDVQALFAGVTLIAPFTNIPNLLLTYKAGGVIPLLGPMRPFKFLHPILDWGVKDQWRSLLRLKEYFLAAERLRKNAPRDGTVSGSGSIHVVHAFDDADISWRQSRALFVGVTGMAANPKLEHRKAVSLEHHQNGTRFTVEFVEHGGHNRVCTYTEVNLAVRRSLTP